MNSTGILSATQTRVMGVLNVTPDSFFGPSRVQSEAVIHKRGLEMIASGAHILDIGGESSRPGAKPVGLEEELERVLPALGVLSKTDALLSVDTYRAETARQAIAHGATMVNDITAFQGDRAMASVVAETDVECVLMHMQGTPESMQDAPKYDDVMDELRAFFEERVQCAIDAGIDRENVWIDPGFGFGKTVQHNLEILNRLGELREIGCRILIGTSNKSMIGAVLDADVDNRSEGTAATVAIAIQNGADAIRVHDVAAMAKVARMTDAVMGRIDID
ncbi:MAG: dihydropteroate synthase [Candidatus Hydrogenedentota bacterium]